MLGLIFTAIASDGHGADSKWRIGESGKRSFGVVESLTRPNLDSYLSKFS